MMTVESDEPRYHLRAVLDALNRDDTVTAPRIATWRSVTVTEADFPNLSIVAVFSCEVQVPAGSFNISAENEKYVIYLVREYGQYPLNLRECTIPYLN